MLHVTSKMKSRIVKCATETISVSLSQIYFPVTVQLYVAQVNPKVSYQFSPDTILLIPVNTYTYIAIVSKWLIHIKMKRNSCL